MSKTSDALARLGISQAEFFAVWLSAKKGNEADKLRLYEMVKKSPPLQALSRGFASQSDKLAQDWRKQNPQPKKRVVSQAGLKAKMNRTGVHAVSGGLPSLGKKS